MAKKTKAGKAKSNQKYLCILRASFTTKDGRKIYAKDYGKKAFRIRIA